MLEIKILKAPHVSDKELYYKDNFVIREGLTVLVGRNGIGKTTLLDQVKKFCDSNSIKVYSYDNYKSGGEAAKSTYLFKNNFDHLTNVSFRSEGEQIFYNLGNQVENIGRFMRDNIHEERVVILLDALDSGLDVDGFRQIKNVINMMIDDFKGSLYVLMSANNYGMVEDSKCLDVKNLEYVEFKDYTEFKTFILDQYKGR